ncbi:ABC transporter ATP-binding protein [Streptomyces pseudovenezuelae]|uniref:Oligopeptide transport system ATP-binding protein n=1 Tax=Streptomyces pseudovenezuelae TaxID=67350 RepID=A0ABT6LCP0_9ACTN|nr:ABC transporter ATP-binding protein [Streptomyces pseudovenezuelae]MDH6214057.1 oligopeptide transport system ATP-binding protein [Streptomyces pseudovenezuelae]
MHANTPDPAEQLDPVPLLDVKDLTVDLLSRGGDGGSVHRVVHGVSFTLHKEETVALIGESGSGKSISAMAVMGLLPATTARVGGSARHQGTDLLTLPPDQLRARRGKRIAMIFQDALSALNPTFSVGFQIAETIRAHEKVGRREARARAVDLMARVRIPDPASRYRDYPHQFSGGMRQRIMIAMAVALRPDVLIADEPTTALDVTVQAQIMELLAELREETGSALLLITHDLGLAAGTADRIAIMYAGRILEQAPFEELYDRPAHPYTRGLLAAVPRLDGDLDDLTPIPGSPPGPGALPSGCPFHPRCTDSRDRCATQPPMLLPVLPNPPARLVACHYPLEVSGA